MRVANEMKFHRLRQAFQPQPPAHNTLHAVVDLAANHRFFNAPSHAGITPEARHGFKQHTLDVPIQEPGWFIWSAKRTQLSSGSSGELKILRCFSKDALLVSAKSSAKNGDFDFTHESGPNSPVT
jgi:hypothetical protein